MNSNFIISYIFLSHVLLHVHADVSAQNCDYKVRDTRKSITHEQAKSIYNKFAIEGHIGGKDASSGYGGPAVKSLLSMADFGVCDPDDIGQGDGDGTSDVEVQRVFEYGCGQGKLAELVLGMNPANENANANANANIHWHGVDQSPEMVSKFQQRLKSVQSSSSSSSVTLMKNGNPNSLIQTVPANHYHRFVSTYCLDLLSEEDMHSVLTLAEHCLRPKDGKLLLAGITYGYGFRGDASSFKTFCMTLAWEIMYRIRPDVVGGCRPQCLRPYLEERGWEIEEEVRTLPVGFPWMVSEVISARRSRSNSSSI